MENLELQKYIASQLHLGIAKEQIQDTLLAHGWKLEDILSSFPVAPNVVAPVLSQPNDVLQTPIEEKKPDVAVDLSTRLQTVETVVNKKVRAPMNIAVLLVVLFVLSLVGMGGVYAYTVYQENPLRVMATAANTPEATSVIMDSTIDIKTPISSGSTKSEQSLKLVANSRIDSLDKANPKLDTTLTVTSSDLGSAFAGQLKFVDKKVYAKVTEIPSVMDELSLDQIRDKWFFVSLDDDALSEVNKSVTKTLTAEQQSKIRQLLLKYNVVTFSKNLTSDPIPGVSTYHFAFTVNKENIAPLIVEINNIVSEKETTEEEKKEIQKVVDAIKECHGEIWIGKNDYRVYQFALSVDMVDVSGENAGSLIMTTHFKDYNKPVSITVPEDAIDILNTTATFQKNDLVNIY